MSVGLARVASMDFAAELVEQNRLFAELALAADPDADVPTCPGWTLRQLVTHMGRGHRWAATITGERSQVVIDPKTVADGKPPADWAGAVDWMANGAQLILDGVEKAGPETAVWTFTGPKPSAWWIRRRLHETVIHRADAAIAAGVPFKVEPDVAADSLSEWLELVTARPAGDNAPLDEGTSLHLHATDEGLTVPGEWILRTADGQITVEHEHAKGTAAVRGKAADLALAMLRRLPADHSGLSIVGDADVLTTWLERTQF